MARAILESEKFAVRALTRDVTRSNALVLRDLGAEVVKGDLNDEASVEAALKGAYGAFVVTSFWDRHGKEKEVCQVGTSLSPSSYPPWRLCPPGKRVGLQSGQKYKPQSTTICLVFMENMYLLEGLLMVKSVLCSTSASPDLWAIESVISFSPVVCRWYMRVGSKDTPQIKIKSEMEQKNVMSIYTYILLAENLRAN